MPSHRPLYLRIPLSHSEGGGGGGEGERGGEGKGEGGGGEGEGGEGEGGGGDAVGMMQCDDPVKPQLLWQPLILPEQGCCPLSQQ